MQTLSGCNIDVNSYGTTNIDKLLLLFFFVCSWSYQGRHPIQASLVLKIHLRFVCPTYFPIIQGLLFHQSIHYCFFLSSLRAGASYMWYAKYNSYNKNFIAIIDLFNHQISDTVKVDYFYKKLVTAGVSHLD